MASKLQGNGGKFYGSILSDLKAADRMAWHPEKVKTLLSDHGIVGNWNPLLQFRSLWLLTAKPKGIVKYSRALFSQWLNSVTRLKAQITQVYMKHSCFMKHSLRRSRVINDQTKMHYNVMLLLFHWGLGEFRSGTCISIFLFCLLIHIIIPFLNCVQFWQEPHASSCSCSFWQVQ